MIVFDGYPEDAATKSTKYAERLRRQQQKTSVDVNFTENMKNTISQENFLSNDNNKNRLIQLLSEKLCAAGFICKQAHEDADRMIIITAIEKLNNYESVMIVGEDVDLLVLMVSLTPVGSKVFS